MAIIRKGDKEAERKLKERAKKENKFDTNFTTKDPRYIKVSKDEKTGKTTASGLDGYRSGPVSGKSIAKAKQSKERIASARTRGGSGVIQSGKLVKGGNVELKDNLDAKGKK